MSSEKIVLIFISFLFSILNCLILIKLLYEINRFKKVDNLKNKLEILKSPFFSNKLIEIKNFSIKNKENIKIYNYLFYKYVNLVVDNNKEITKNFIKILKKEVNYNSFIIESRFLSNVYNDFKINENKINEFSNELNVVFALENIVFGRINLLNLILDKSSEELDKLNLTFEIDINFLRDKIKLIFKNLKIFELKVYQIDYLEMQIQLESLSNEIVNFTEDLIIWIKVISLFELLKQKQEYLLRLIDKLKRDNWIFLIQKLNRNFQKINIQLFEQIEKFEPKRTKNILLNLLFEIEGEIQQIKDIEFLNKMFFESFKFVKEKFELLQLEFYKFNDLIKNFEKTNFFSKLQEIEFKNFKMLMTETKKNIEFLVIDEEYIKKRYFLNDDLFKVKNICKNLINLLENLPKMFNFFNSEKQKNNEMFMVLINIKSLFLKQEFSYIKNIYSEKYKNIMNKFLSFKKEQNSTSSKVCELLIQYNTLFSDIRNLKRDIKESILFKNIADELFVRVNRFRFNNDFSRNKILNAEIMFIKYDFKNVIQKLIEIYESEKLLWNN